jgi:hypothetical protein
MKKLIYIFSLLLLLNACGDNKNKQTTARKTPAKQKVLIPDFNSDSAYLFVEKQVTYGPRVPNTKEHSNCAQFLFNKLKSYADTAMIQTFKTRAYNNNVLNGKNIIGAFNPENGNRILLCAHWDTRPYADYDENPDNHRKPIDGANDGASGVGVLLEIARQMNLSKPGIGVDIIFFDVEDYGPPQELQMHGSNFWGLGSQYWSRNPHDPDYVARYGILLDMVGASNATFLMEGHSMLYAAGILKKVWTIGHRLGYSEYFLFEQGGYIDDDHKYVNEIIKIPTIDIIHLDSESSTSSFFEHWHTLGDTMDVIDKETLKVVGQTLLTVIFEEK